MNKLIYNLLTGMFLLLAAGAACADSTIDIEGGYVYPGYIDVAVPGDTGSRFSLTDDLDARGTGVFRARCLYEFNEKHRVGLLVAPLTVEAEGRLDVPIEFNDTTFMQGESVDATFRFDSYRLIYRYCLYDKGRWTLRLGGAIKVRDAEIRLESADTSTAKKNTGIVPLLSFHLGWAASEKLHLIMDGEALAAPQGRAEDVLVAMQYAVKPNLQLKAGYRILEGGADNDEVYTFSLLNYAVAGVTWSF